MVANKVTTHAEGRHFGSKIYIGPAMKQNKINFTKKIDYKHVKMQTSIVHKIEKTCPRRIFYVPFIDKDNDNSKDIKQ